MRTIARGFLTTAMVATLLVAPVGSASAAVLDDYCSESGDYCTFVIEKASGKVVFKIRAFADYFGRAKACVIKDTRVCHRRSPHDDGVIWQWKIAWQGNYPDEGAGEYTVKWFAQEGGKIGPALHFER